MLMISRGDGGATMTQPANGFADPAIFTMFNPPKANTPTEPVVLTPSGLSQPGLQRGGRRNNSVIGGVIGAVGGWLVLTLAVSICILRRRRRARKAQSGTENEYSSPKELAGESQFSSSPHEIGGPFPDCEELEAKYPPQELSAEVTFDNIKEEIKKEEMEETREDGVRENAMEDRARSEREACDEEHAVQPTHPGQVKEK
jgi:hypothetical protein